MFQSLRTFFLFFVVVVAQNNTFGQDEPYYELPSKRTNGNSAPLPNLKAVKQKIYLRPEGGLKFQHSTLASTIPETFTKNKNINTTGGFALGYNYADKWLLEAAYLRNTQQMQSTFSYNNYTMYNRPEVIFQSTALRFQRKIFTIDRVSRTTGLFFGGGIVYNTNAKNGEFERSSFSGLLRNGSGIRPDTLTLRNITLLRKSKIHLEFSGEVRGKIIEKLEIGAFIKTHLTAPRSLESNSTLFLNQNQLGTAQQHLGWLAWQMGISLHYNFLIFNKYKNPE